MIKATVRDLLQHKLDYLDLEGVYTFRDGECVLYIGRSYDVVTRMYNHIESWAISAIGDVIHINAPQSLSWQIELREPEECREFVKLLYPLYEDTNNPIGIELAERSMIMHYHPCLNTANNPYPNPMPDFIRRYPCEFEPGLTDNLY